MLVVIIIMIMITILFLVSLINLKYMRFAAYGKVYCYIEKLQEIEKEGRHE
jgi:hypothetical protein